MHVGAKEHGCSQDANQRGLELLEDVQEGVPREVQQIPGSQSLEEVKVAERISPSDQRVCREGGGIGAGASRGDDGFGCRNGGRGQGFSTGNS